MPRCRLSVAKEMVADVRPELFGQIVSSVEGHARSHRVGEVPNVSFIRWIVGPANGARGRAAQDNRDIKDRTSSVSARYEDASRVIKAAGHNTAASHPVVAGISVKDGRIDT